MRELSFYRQKIDEIDEEILRLLNERAKNVIAVGEIKKKNNAPIWVPSREQAIFDRLKKLNTGPFPSASIRPIFREIISASLSLEDGIYHHEPASSQILPGHPPEKEMKPFHHHGIVKKTRQFVHS